MADQSQHQPDPNAYRSPAPIDSFAIGVNSGTRQDLVKVAIFQRAIIVLIIIRLILAFVALPLFEMHVEWLNWAITIAFNVLGLFTLYCIVVVAIRVFPTPAAVMLTFAVMLPSFGALLAWYSPHLLIDLGPARYVFSPLVGLVMLAIITLQATAVLKKNGIQVGLLGASMDQFGKDGSPSLYQQFLPQSLTRSSAAPVNASSDGYILGREDLVRIANYLRTMIVCFLLAIVLIPLMFSFPDFFNLIFPVTTAVVLALTMSNIMLATKVYTSPLSIVIALMMIAPSVGYAIRSWFPDQFDELGHVSALLSPLMGLLAVGIVGWGAAAELTWHGAKLGLLGIEFSNRPTVPRKHGVDWLRIGWNDEPTFATWLRNATMIVIISQCAALAASFWLKHPTLSVVASAAASLFGAGCVYAIGMRVQHSVGIRLGLVTLTLLPVIGLLFYLQEPGFYIVSVRTALFFGSVLPQLVVLIQSRNLFRRSSRDAESAVVIE